jgi:hypothetical protein
MAEDQVPLGGGGAKIEHGGACSLAGIGVGAVLW